MEHGITFLRDKKLYLPSTEPKENELLANYSFQKYLEARDCVSSTGLRKLLQSPRHYLSWLIDNTEEETDYYRFGRAAHMMMLEPEEFRKRYLVMPDFGDMRSSKNRAQRDEWLSQCYDSAVVVTNTEYDDLVGMAEAIQAHGEANNIMRNCKTEVTGFFTCPETNLRCKIRPDILHEDEMGLSIWDYKTTSFLAGCVKDIETYGYHIQLGFYYYGLSVIYGTDPFSAGLMFQEKKRPWEPDPIYMEEETIKKGVMLAKHGLKVLRKCIDTNIWPFSKSGVRMAGVSQWVKSAPLPEFNFGDSNEN